MSQHDMIIANASGAAVRADLNNALAALGSTMKGPNAPPAPIAGMMWLDDDAPSASVWTLNLYDGADWISIATFDISANTWTPVITRLALGAGSAAAPTYSFSGDPDTGILNSAANAMAVSLGGIVTFVFEPTGSTVRSGGSLLFSEASNNNTWGLSNASNDLIFRYNGTEKLRFDSVGAILRDGNGLRLLESGNNNTWAINNVSNNLVLRYNGADRAQFDANGDLKFNSGYGSAALAFGVRAWVNFNGTGTVAIRGSGGVTSITDNGTGDYTINFNFTMPDANYCVVGVGASSGPDMLPLGIKGDVPPTTTNVRVWVKSVGVAAGAFDPLYASVAIIR